MKKQRREAYGLLAPLSVFLIALLGFPVLVDVVYSLSQVSFESLRTPQPIGLQNYWAVLHDTEYWAAAWFSLRFALVVSSAQLALGLSLAVFLAPLLQRRPWLMAVLMLPMMVAPALVGLMYRLILHEFVGVVPYYLLLWFDDYPSFLGIENVFWTLVVVETLQWTPFALLILYSAFCSIPVELREAAALDGAHGWQLLIEVELPLMVPAVAVTFFIRFIDSFRVFDNIYTLVGAGAGGSTTTMSIYIYQAFFKSGDIGRAVAASMLLLIASFSVVFLATRLGAWRARS